MASKRRGKRVCTMPVGRKKTSQRRHIRRNRHSKETAASSKERRQLVQLVVSGGLFVFLVAATWFLPGRTEGLSETLSGAIGRNMDVQAVFSAVGRAFQGENGIGQDLYRAVFRPVEAESQPENPAIHSEPEDSAAWESLHACRGVTAEPVSSEEDAATAQTLAYVLYSQQNLPEKVSLEQAILGFDYCAPVQGSLSSGFGYREHPTEGDDRFHYGVDLAADSGADIRCFADGTVLAVGDSSSYGKYCIVSHANGFRTLYAHCNRVTATSGAVVQRGQVIAKVGETGMATGPHLHFELQRDGTYLNPIYYVAQV